MQIIDWDKQKRLLLPNFGGYTPVGTGYKLITELTEDEVNDLFEKRKKRTLPSAHQIGDQVKISFLKDELEKVTIIKVHFTESKILYDVEILDTYENGVEYYTTRIYNVDSVFVYK